MTRNAFSPLFGPLIGCVLGIFVQKTFCVSWYLLIAGLSIVVIVAALVIITQQKKVLVYLLSALAFCSGAYLLTLQKNYHNLLQTLFAQKSANFRATIIGKEDWINQANTGSVLRLRIHEVTLPEEKARFNVTFDCLCYSPRRLSLTIGDYVQLHNIVIKQPDEQSTDNNSSYNNFLCKENIIGSVFISQSKQYRLISRPHLSWDRWLWNIRDSFYITLKQKLSGKAFSFFGLIFMGNKQQVDIDHMRSLFGHWGLSHYLARSGLHIVLFMMMLTILFGLIPVHKSYKNIIILVLCFLYDLLSWSSIPFVRAYYAVLISKIGDLLGLQVHLAHIVTLICLAMLLNNPMQLFFLDFQLTFALTFTLIFLSHVSPPPKAQE